jgi:hypothetical protein
MIDSVQCSECGADRPPELVTGAPPPPCPDCGGTALKIGVSESVAVTAALSVVAELTPPFEDRDWRHRWERLQAHEAELSKARTQALSGASIQGARDELHSFYIQAYHLKDALKNDAAALGFKPQEVEAAINTKPALELAADLANLDKHGVFNKGYKVRSGHTPRTVDVSGITVPDGWRLNLIIQHGPQQIDGVTLASEIIDQWREVLTKFGVI